ncbi:MAG: helix-turn-helix domain-containing protein, partial [Bacteroidota bacterium]
QFRSDLFHRINSFVIQVPPLRERKEDIPLLLQSFFREFSKRLNKNIADIDKKIPSLLSLYDFPGNIRELRNMVERAVILCNGSVLKPSLFPVIVSKIQKTTKELTELPMDFNLEKNEKSLIIKALDKSGKNKNLAARMLNISWQSLDRRMQKYEIPD